MTHKATMKKGDFLNEVEDERYYPLKCVDVTDYTPDEGAPQYGDAVYVHYEVFDKELSLGQIRELCSLKLSPNSKLHDRYTSMMDIDEVEEGEDVDIDICVGKWMQGLLTNGQKGDSKFVNISKTKPFVGDAPETEENPADVGGSEEIMVCPECDLEIDADAEKCPGCGVEFEEEGDDSEPETEPEEDAQTCAWCKGNEARRDLREIDGDFYHDEYGLRCADEYEKEKKHKVIHEKKAKRKQAKTPPKKKVSKPKPKKKTTTKKKPKKKSGR